MAEQTHTSNGQREALKKSTGETSISIFLQWGNKEWPDQVHQHCHPKLIGTPRHWRDSLMKEKMKYIRNKTEMEAEHFSCGWIENF